MAFRTQKISQMTPKGSDLEATDLIEVSTIESGSYVTRSITGQEIIDAAVGNVDWGDIGGTLSAQTDLQTALDAKVPTSRTLTINGTTQDLSADRTFTISTGITIGTTAITSGTVGRVLFQGTGNVVQQSSSLFWDATNNRLGVGTSSPNVPLEVVGSNLLGIRAQINVSDVFDAIQVRNSSSANSNQVRIKFDNENTVTPSSGGVIFYTGNNYSLYPQNSFGFWNHTSNGIIALATNNTERLRLTNGGNVLINTTTDAGFKLDVNGTARVQTSFLLGSSLINANTTAFPLQVNFTNAASNVGAIWRNGSSTGYTSFRFYNNINDGSRALEMGYSGSAFSGAIISGGIAGESGYITTTGAYPLQLGSNNLTRLILASTGNVLINTTTDAGFRLDVNGTARVINDLQIGSGTSIVTGIILKPATMEIQLSQGSGVKIRMFREGNDSLSFTTSGNSYAGNLSTAGLYVGGGNANSKNDSAMLQADSTTRGFLPPRQTQAQRTAIASPAVGLIVYQTDLTEGLYIYKSTGWTFIV